MILDKQMYSFELSEFICKRAMITTWKFEYEH